MANEKMTEVVGIEELNRDTKINIMEKSNNTSNEQVNHPSHYNQSGFECIEVMEAVFGREAVLNFCVLNSFKYLWRHGHKGKAKEDIEKSEWYSRKAKELMEKKDK